MLHITIETPVSPSFLGIDGDDDYVDVPASITRYLSCLPTLALMIAPPGSTVTVHTSPRASLAVAVQEGDGLKPDMTERIFNRQFGREQAFGQALLRLLTCYTENMAWVIWREDSAPSPDNSGKGE